MSQSTHQNLDKLPLDISDEDGILIERHKNPKGRRIPLHWHEFLEFEIVVSGTARHIYNQQEYLLTRGSAYMTSYHDFHELLSLTDLDIYCIHFTKQILDPEIARFLDYNKFHCQLSEEETRWAVQHIEELIAEINSSHPLRSLMIRNLFSEIIIMMIRKSSPGEREEMPLPIQQVLAYMNETFRSKLTLRKVSEQFSFSPNYLGHLFKQQMGCTFNEYLHTLRLKYACSLLQKSDLSIKEIAAASGYGSTEHFVSSFKQKMQMTPGEYRRQ
ncbi:MAG: helix-turn-helix domain-containing protein [Lachnospiraceae bacterium]|nr:helix-turn-helix domain-containing protein [Lachnospiraceae bacterium]